MLHFHAIPYRAAVLGGCTFRSHGFALSSLREIGQTVAWQRLIFGEIIRSMKMIYQAELANFTLSCLFVFTPVFIL